MVESPKSIVHTHESEFSLRGRTGKVENTRKLFFILSAIISLYFVSGEKISRWSPLFIFFPPLFFFVFSFWWKQIPVKRANPFTACSILLMLGKFTRTITTYADRIPLWGWKNKKILYFFPPRPPHMTRPPTKFGAKHSNISNYLIVLS